MPAASANRSRRENRGATAPAAFRTTPCGFSRNDLARSAVRSPKRGLLRSMTLCRRILAGPAKGLRGALCCGTCASLGGSRRQALNAAVAIELLHNVFLIRDDVQDEASFIVVARLFQEHGISIAVNATRASTMPDLRRANCPGRLCSRRWQRFAEYRTPKKSASSWK